MRDQVRAIKEDDELGSLDRLLARVGGRPAGAWELQPFNLRSARSRIEVLALLGLSPRDRLGDVRITELVTGGRVAREVFRASDWQGLSQEVGALARTAANRALLGAAHTGLSAELRSWEWSHDQVALRSHAIDERAFDLLRRQEVEAFLRHRAARVCVAVDAFLAERAAWDEPELRPLSVYLEAEEGES